MKPAGGRLRALLVSTALIMAAGCDDAGDRALPEPADTYLVPYAPPSARRAPVLDASAFPELSSTDCVEVVRFYLEAIGRREYDKAALVWNDPVIDAARLRAAFGDYQEPLFEWTEPFVDGTAGSLYCTAGGTLFDAKDPTRPIVQGTLTLRRASEASGATPGQLRWTLQSSTFVEELRRSEG